MKENIGDKIENGQDKIVVGKACIFGIFVASIFSNIYIILSLNIRVFNEIKEAIIDASSFFNIVCISYLVVSLRPKKRNRKLAIGCIINLILNNQLFSNKKLFKIGMYLNSFIQKVNPYIAAFCCIISFVIVLVVYGFYKKKKASNNNDGKREGIEHSQIVQEERQSIEEIDSERGYRESERMPREVKKETGKIFQNRASGEEREHKSKSESGKERGREKKGKQHELKGTIHSIFLGILLFLFLTGVVSYAIYKIPNLGISNLVNNLEKTELFYFVPISVGLVALMVLIVWLTIYEIKKVKAWSENGRGLTFRGSAILAIILVIVLYIYADQIKQRKWTDNILSILTDNSFSLFIGLFLVFLVLQIIVMMVGNLLLRPKMTDEKKEPIEPIIKEMSDRTRSIELRIVKLALNLVEGGIAIFDFIPDFFTTIAALLLGKKIKLENLNDENKDKSRDKSERDKESHNI